MFPSVLKCVHHSTSLNICDKIILKVSIKISTYNNNLFPKKEHFSYNPFCLSKNFETVHNA